MPVSQTFATGKVERSKVTRYKRGTTETKIIYVDDADRQKRVIIFPYVAVVLRGDQIELGLKPGMQIVVFKNTSAWENMVMLLQDAYGIDISTVTMEQIHELVDGAARRDAEFAKVAEELQSYEVRKIYDVTQDIIYHVET